MPTIAQAQAKFLREGGPKGGTSKGGVYVVKQGKNKADFSKVSGNLGVVQAMIAEYIAEFIKNAEDNLKESNSNTTGALTDSLDFDLTTTATGYTINLNALDYYKFVDEGVRGAGRSLKNNTSPYKFKFLNPSKSHVTAIEKWIIRNRLVSRVSDIQKYGATKRESKSIGPTKGRRGLAYVIAKSIKNDGLRATNFFTDALNDTFKDFGQNLSKALGASITINLQQMADQFKKGQGVNIPR
jgi:hypothetical protein